MPTLGLTPGFSFAAWAVTWGWVIGSLGLCAWLALRMRAVPSVGARRGWVSLLFIAGVVTAGSAAYPWRVLPVLHWVLPTVPVRTVTATYAGPDLLSDEDPETRGWNYEGFTRGVTLVGLRRTVQGETLLSEDRQLRVALPLPLLVVWIAWLAAAAAPEAGVRRRPPTP